MVVLDRAENISYINDVSQALQLEKRKAHLAKKRGVRRKRELLKYWNRERLAQLAKHCEHINLKMSSGTLEENNVSHSWKKNRERKSRGKKSTIGENSRMQTVRKIEDRVFHAEERELL